MQKEEFVISDLCLRVLYRALILSGRGLSCTKNIAILFCTITWFTHVFVARALPVLLPLATKEFSLSYAEAGILATSSQMVFALMQAPAGYLASKVRSRKAIVFAIGFLSISIDLLAFSANHVQFFILTMLGTLKLREKREASWRRRKNG